jgi:predicted acyltransferase
VLQHIAGAYLLAWAVLRLPRRVQVPVAIGIVGAMWIGFAAWGAGGDPWAMGDTLAHDVDGVLLGSFTTEGTLQTLVSASTVLAGAFVGRLVRATPDAERLVRPVAAGAVGFVAAGLLMALVVPINKHLWTPSYTVLTIGTSLTLLALGLWLIDVCGMRRITEPLVHLGANPIAIYIASMAALFGLRNYADGLLPTIEPAGSAVAGAFLYAFAWTALWWLVARTLFRRQIFIKI